MNKVIFNKVSIFFPAFIFSLCFLELSFGKLIEFRVIWFLYVYFFYFFIFRFHKNKFIFKFNSLFLYFLWISTFTLAAIFSNQSYEIVNAELFNILWWTIFSFLIASELKSYIKQEVFFKIFIKLIFFGTLISSIIGLVKFFSLTKGVVWSSSYSDSGILIEGSSLNADYNIYCLGIMFGALAGKFLRDIYPTKINALMLKFAFPIFILSMVLSGSRRGYLLGVLLIIIFVFVNFANSFSLKKIFFKRKISLLIASSFFVLFFIVSYRFLEKAVSRSEFNYTPISRILTLKKEISESNERTLRWNYSWELIKNESFCSLIFGNGFGYIDKFATNFHVDNEDHPHNFLLSTFLYGGLISILILWFNLFSIFKPSFVQNITFFFFICLLFLIVFSLTSTNTLFSYRVFFVLFLLPKLIPLKHSA